MTGNFILVTEPPTFADIPRKGSTAAADRARLAAARRRWRAGALGVLLATSTSSEIDDLRNALHDLIQLTIMDTQ